MKILFQKIDIAFFHFKKKINSFKLLVLFLRKLINMSSTEKIMDSQSSLLQRKQFGEKNKKKRNSSTPKTYSRQFFGITEEEENIKKRLQMRERKRLHKQKTPMLQQKTRQAYQAAINENYESTQLDHQLDNTILNGNYVNDHTEKKLHLPVHLKNDHMKGWGLFANRNIRKGVVVSLYKVLVKAASSYVPIKNGIYAIDLHKQTRSKTYVTDLNFVGDLYENSLEPPVGPERNGPERNGPERNGPERNGSRIQQEYMPFWGYFSNEPSLTLKNPQEANVYLDWDDEENFKRIFALYKRKKLKENDVWILKLKTFRSVKKNEELTWCYGSSYQPHRQTVKGNIMYIPNCDINVKYTISSTAKTRHGIWTGKPNIHLQEVIEHIRLHNNIKKNLIPLEAFDVNKSIFEIKRYLQTLSKTILRLKVIS